MALTTGTKTLVDATAVSPDSSANALSHGGDHKAIHAALKEVYGARRYKCVVSQSGSAAPTAVVLENTLVTTPVWTRFSTGLYYLTFGTGECSASKVVVTFPSEILVGGSYYRVAYTFPVADVMGFVTLGVTSGSYTDSALSNTPIVIEVYP